MDLKRSCQNQAEEAKKYKWIVGEKLGYDPGNSAIFEWVDKYAAKYRQEYKHCYNSIIDKIITTITPNFTSLPTDQLRTLTISIIDEFVKEWIKQEAIGIKHNDEI